MKTRQGSVLVVVLMTILILSACVGGALALTSEIGKNTQRSVVLRSAAQVGDGAIDYAYAFWQNTYSDRASLPLNTNDFAGLSMPTSDLFPDIANFTASSQPNSPDNPPFTVANFKIVALDAFWRPLTDPEAAPQPSYGASPGTASYNYLASADVTLPAVGAAGVVTAKVRRIFRKEVQSPWQFAIFYVDDLEMAPGVPQKINGPVWGGGPLFTPHNQLTLLNAVSYHGKQANAYSPKDPRSTSEGPQPGPIVDPNYPMKNEGSTKDPVGLSPSGFDKNDPNNTGYHELIERPDSTVADPFAGSRFDTTADLKIHINTKEDTKEGPLAIYVAIDPLSNPPKARNYREINAASTGADAVLYNGIQSAVKNNTTIFDKREQAQVGLVDINLGLFQQLTNFGGTLYVSNQNTDFGDRQGVRITDAATITSPIGITIATDGGLYIQGDFNTGRTQDAEPASNQDDPSQPTVDGYDKKPCAVAADAVMILSNSWNDANSSKDLKDRRASPTTINTAIISGIVPSNGVYYSGGEENFPRFLENWDKVRMTYFGSMVEMYPSQMFNQHWGKNGVYSPPNRNWNFDQSFMVSPPPGGLSTYKLSKGRWFLE